MPLEIGDNPDFNEIEKLLKDSVRNDFLNYISDNGKSLNKEQIEIINEHFKHYNSCIKKLHETIKFQTTQTAILETALSLQSKQIKALNEEIRMHKKTLKKILSVRILGVKLF